MRRTTNTLSGVGICCASGLWVVGRRTEAQTLKVTRLTELQNGLPRNKGLTVSDNLSIRLQYDIRALKVEVLKTEQMFVFSSPKARTRG
jgi:hypothetical protein